VEAMSDSGLEAVFGQNTANGVGVAGWTSGGTPWSYGIWGKCMGAQGYAGYFEGGKGVKVVGNVTADSFCIGSDCITSWPSGGSTYWTQQGSSLYPNNTNWNVGIGTTSPSEKLHVKGKAKIEGNLNVTGNTQLGDSVGGDIIDVYGDINVHGNDLAGLKNLLADPNSDLTIVTVGKKVNIVGDLDVLNVNIKGRLNVTGNTQLGKSSADKTIVKGDLEVSGKISGGTCSCDGTGWEVKNRSGVVVYVDCNADKCWTPTVAAHNWSSAMNYCSNLNYGGFSDWRLPDLTTLGNLCSSDSCSGTCFGGDGFAGAYWSSTEYSSSAAYLVFFSDCDVSYSSKAAPFHVRCVRP